LRPGPPKLAEQMDLLKDMTRHDLRNRVLYPAMDKAGVERKVARPYGFHLFRHSAGAQLQEVTGDLNRRRAFWGARVSGSRVTFTFTCSPTPKLSR
jgi:hypothetical protein